MQKYLNDCVVNKEIVFGRRLKIEKEVQVKKENGSGSKAAEVFPIEILDLPLVAIIDGRKYAVRLHILDPSAQLGQSGGSYVKYHACAGIPIEVKGAIPKNQMGFMFAHYFFSLDLGWRSRSQQEP